MANLSYLDRELLNALIAGDIKHAAKVRRGGAKVKVPRGKFDYREIAGVDKQYLSLPPELRHKLVVYLELEARKKYRKRYAARALSKEREARFDAKQNA